MTVSLPVSNNHIPLNLLKKFNSSEGINVKKHLPDGTLCYANHDDKAGIGVARPDYPAGDWQRSEVKAGIFTYKFKSTATHNPSFWEFYLTKPEADLSKQLAWDDLTLIAERGKHGDRIMPVNKTYPNGDRHGEYVMDITIPEERRGNAILFVRWQRVDAAGEGFYNCSDIKIIDPEVDIPSMPEADLEQGSRFISDGTESVNINDKVTYSVFNNEGVEEHVSSIVITSESIIMGWPESLSSKVNRFYSTKKSNTPSQTQGIDDIPELNHGDVFIGYWNMSMSMSMSMSHYMFSSDESKHENYFHSKDGLKSGTLVITKAEELPADNYELKIIPKVMTVLKVKG